MAFDFGGGEAVIGFIPRLLHVKIDFLYIARVGVGGVVHFVVPATGIGAGALVRVAVVEVARQQATP